MKVQDSEDCIMKTFKIFDKDSNDYISSYDFKLIMDNLGENISEEDIKDLFSNNEKKGSIKFEEFKNFMK